MSNRMRVSRPRRCGGGPSRERVAHETHNVWWACQEPTFKVKRLGLSSRTRCLLVTKYYGLHNTLRLGTMD